MLREKFRLGMKSTSLPVYELYPLVLQSTISVENIEFGRVQDHMCLLEVLTNLNCSWVPNWLNHSYHLTPYYKFLQDQIQLDYEVKYVNSIRLFYIHTKMAFSRFIPLESNLNMQMNKPLQFPW